VAACDAKADDNTTENVRKQQRPKVGLPQGGCKRSLMIRPDAYGNRKRTTGKTGEEREGRKYSNIRKYRKTTTTGENMSKAGQLTGAVVVVEVGITSDLDRRQSLEPVAEI